MLEKHGHTVSSLQGEPFSAALMGLCLGGHQSQSRLRLRRRGLNLSLNLTNSLGSQGKEKPGRYESRRTEISPSPSLRPRLRARFFKEGNFPGWEFPPLPKRGTKGDLAQ
jgi:hypothetical protein